jgi:aldose 1-epimerase
MIERAAFGVLPGGDLIEWIALSLDNGFSVAILSWGATLQSLWAPDIEGRLASVVLGYASLDEYLAAPGRMGATIGRYANRIARGCFEVDGVLYQIQRNDGKHAIHGGARGLTAGRGGWDTSWFCRNKTVRYDSSERDE